MSKFFTKTVIFILPLMFLFSFQLMATHNRAGHISVKQVGDCVESLTIEATITTYTKASSRPADRDTLDICWGDGTCERVARSNGPGDPPNGVLLENDIKVNTYTATHAYPARGTYVISMNDPNRNGGILNVNFPNSDQVRFHIQTTYTFPNPQFQGCNSTPILLQPPIDVGCVGKVFTHNPNVYDEEGDSLSYHFIVPLMDVGQEVPGYVFPDMIEPGPNNKLTIDEKTGDIVWESPQKAGEYNLAMIIVSYRQGIALDTIIRDMQILILECPNEPPTVETSLEEICVVAGEIVEIEVVAGAPEFETDQLVQLTALGGPFEVEISPATFTPDDNSFQDDPVTKFFQWETSCEHISDQFYTVVFKATDDFFGDTTGLATLKTVRIKVVGPPPEDVRAVSEDDIVEVTWEMPYVCENAANDYFRGFTVWRRIGSNIFPIDTCTPGLDGRGYEKLTPVAIEPVVNGRYSYTDSSVERGRTYCYRILAEFAQTTPGGSYTYNVVESLPSMEACVQLSRDIPLITNVDILSTSNSDGNIEVCWSKPLAVDLDTIMNPGPYRYEVLRATGLNPSEGEFQPIGVTFDSPTFEAANDTCFTDSSLDTEGNPYSYKVNFYSNNLVTPLGATNPASSVYLSISPTDRRNNLSWEENVPWDNYEYHIFRQNAQGQFDSIGISNINAFSDDGLVNGVEYCYKIRSVGSYGVDGIISPILNHSQETCSIPFDNVAPCPPELDVRNICDEGVSCSDENNLFNTLIWNNPIELCDEGDDVLAYNVYFAPFEGEDFVLVARIDGAENTLFDHQPEIGIAGCYAVSALDTNLNESALSNVVCVDNCPFYTLPNSFTPNSDGQNDIFKPFPYCFVERVEFQVFNRWGQLVFKTEDPDLNWNGENLTGSDLAEGTYYYKCQVFERRVSGITPSPELLSGWIELIRNGR